MQGDTVLVVEDEPVVREQTVEVLADLGYTALQAAAARAGLARLRAPGRIGQRGKGAVQGSLLKLNHMV